MDGESCGDYYKDLEQAKWQKWFDSLTPEEQAEYKANMKFGDEAVKVLADDITNEINKAIMEK